MNKLLNQLKYNPIIQQLASLTITVVCLAFLFILTFWGTIAQVNNGLYASQERFFYSWFFMVFGFIPFPGAQLVLWIMFINLSCATITRFKYQWNKIGISLIHIGLMLYFVSAFLTFNVTEESNVHFAEGEGTNLSASYHDWELSVSNLIPTESRNVIAFDASSFNASAFLKDPQWNFDLHIQSYYPNSSAYAASDVQLLRNPINGSGISSLSEKKLDKEPEKNLPGLIFTVLKRSGEEASVLLYGGETNPTSLMVEDQRYYFQLRHRRHELPFTITLNDFQMEKHPGTEIAKSYKSFVNITHDTIKRDTIIFMNNPFRFKDYTLYQASYALDQNGREYSTLAVVKNAWRLMPYIASFVVFFGLAIHFLSMAFIRKPKIK